MAEVFLDFEKPLVELEKKLKEWQALSVSSKIDVSNEIELLSKKIEETRKNIYESLTPWQRVMMARHQQRPYTMDYIELIFEDFLEFHGDRRYGEDPAIVAGFAKIGGRAVAVIGTQKGRNTKENVFRNFGCPHPEGYRKALRVMKLADLAQLPIVSLIDTPGAFPGVASEERHIGEAIAVNLKEMFSLSVPVIAIVIGEGGSGGALGIGIGNKILVMENAYYSVITPEGCASILWKDRTFAAKAAESLKLTAKDLQELGIVDEIIGEPMGGAHRDYKEAAESLKKAIVKNLDSLSSQSSEELKTPAGFATRSAFYTLRWIRK